MTKNIYVASYASIYRSSYFLYIMHVKIIGNRNFHYDSSTTACKRCRCRYRDGQNGYACPPPLLGHRRDAPSISSPHSITDIPEIPPRPMTNVHADANAENARRCGHGHAVVGMATPPRYARCHRPPRGLSLCYHTPLAPIYTRQKGETLVFSTLLTFMSDTICQSVEVVVDVLDHFFSSLHG
jgi:hypothetical protein